MQWVSCMSYGSWIRVKNNITQAVKSQPPRELQERSHFGTGCRKTPQRNKEVGISMRVRRVAGLAWNWFLVRVGNGTWWSRMLVPKCVQSLCLMEPQKTAACHKVMILCKLDSSSKPVVDRLPAFPFLSWVERSVACVSSVVFCLYRRTAVASVIRNCLVMSFTVQLISDVMFTPYIVRQRQGIKATPHLWPVWCWCMIPR